MKTTPIRHVVVGGRDVSQHMSAGFLRRWTKPNGFVYSELHLRWRRDAESAALAGDLWWSIRESGAPCEAEIRERCGPVGPTNCGWRAAFVLRDDPPTEPQDVLVLVQATALEEIRA
ncbi:MAG TPA: hypothetical protein VF746_13375 [Longimicrobium sp.]